MRRGQTVQSLRGHFKDVWSFALFPYTMGSQGCNMIIFVFSRNLVAAVERTYWKAPETS